jgi:hypothetical protein
MQTKQLLRKYILLYENIDFGDFEVTQEHLNNILKGYLEAAVWTDGEQLQDDYKNNLGYDESDWNDDENKQQIEFTIDDLEDDSKIQAYNDIKIFIKAAGLDALTEAVNENGFFQLGMDIWLTRNHHGAGFLDHNYENEIDLIVAAHNLKEVNIYLTDNNMLSFSNV